METLNGILIFETDKEIVSWILDIASRTVQISKDSGYNFDYHSIEEVVKLTEAILADHKELLRQQKGLSDIIISPGSRNAPIIIAFANKPGIGALSIVDE